MPPELDFRSLRAQVEAVTKVPDFTTVSRRARKVRRRDRFAIAGALMGTLAVFSPIALTALQGGTVASPAMLGRPDTDPYMVPLPTSYDPDAQLPKVTATVRAVGGALPDDVFVAVDACSTPADDAGHPRCSLQVSLMSKAATKNNATAIVSSLIRSSPTDQLEDIRLSTLTPTSVLLSATIAGGASTSVRITETGGSPVHAPTTSVGLDAGARPIQLTDHGQIYGVRETDGQLSRIASQPELTMPMVATSVAPGEGWWVSGYDTVTGKASVAVSRDQGQHWTVRSLGATALDVPTIATVDGRTTDAFVRSSHGIAHYRSTDGGESWTEELPQIVLPGVLSSDGALVGRDFGALARADHSLLIWVADTTPVYLNSSDGRIFQAYQGPTGQVYAVDGGFVALGDKPQISLDCVNWAPATLPQPVAPTG